MTRSPKPPARNEDGSALILEMMIAWFMVLAVVVAFGGLIGYSYVKGVAHSAVDQGARVGSRLDGSANTCETRVRAVLSDLSPADASVSCTDDGEMVTARVSFDLHVPVMRDSSVVMTGQARKERVPT